jgi:hypothetical protein
MGLQLVYRVAVDGKPPVTKKSRTSELFADTRRLTFAVVAFFMTTLAAPTSYAQSSGPYAGMAGKWAGGGTVTLDDGSIERIRCRASDAVGAGGAGLNMTLVCASDSYRFDLRGSVISERGALSGTWSESTRGVNGALRGRGGNGNFQVVATAGGFTAQLSVTTRGNRQTIGIQADSGFRDATITMSRY